MRLFLAFFDMAEYQAENHNVMHMSDYVEQLDRTIKSVVKKFWKAPVKSTTKKPWKKQKLNIESIR